MHSWVFRNRKRLERLYGLPPGREETTRPRPLRTPRPALHVRLPPLVLIPRPRRVA
ncbi:MAG: hypothetical protein AAF682_30205 [Planctomycetota bacterium]